MVTLSPRKATGQSPIALRNRRADSSCILHPRCLCRLMFLFTGLALFAISAIYVVHYKSYLTYSSSDFMSSEEMIRLQASVGIVHQTYGDTLVNLEDLQQRQLTVADLLEPDRIPGIVHIVWCFGNETYFNYKNFLSIRSVIKFLQPDLIFFHAMLSEPVMDPLSYNDWFDRIRRDTNNFVIVRHHDADPSSEDPDTCMRNNIDFIIRNYSAGGIYVPSNVVLTKPLTIKIKTGQSASQKMVLDSIIYFRNKTIAAIQDCSETSSQCMSLRSNVSAYPQDFWVSSGDHAQLARYLTYDQCQPMIIHPNPHTLVPLIVHYFWLGGGNLEFLLFLSILSSLNVLKVEAVIVHGDLEPTGPYWKQLCEMNDGRLHYVYRALQPSIYGTPIGQFSAMSDVLRTDVLLKYGGIYVDWDLIFVKPIDVELRSYEAVVSPDWPNKLKPYPQTLNLGVMLAKPGSVFVQRLQESLVDYADGVGPLQWCFICLRSYKVLERYPNTAKLEPHLQVQYYLGRYHPVWQPGSGDDLFDGKFDWRTETYSVHWTWPTPVELRGPRQVYKLNTTAAQIARMVIELSKIKF